MPALRIGRKQPRSVECGHRTIGSLVAQQAPGLQGRHRLFGQRHQTFFAAFALDHNQPLAHPPQRIGQCHQFRHAQAGGIDQFQQCQHPRRPPSGRQRGITGVDSSIATGLIEQARHIIDAEHLGQRTALPRAFEPSGGVVRAQALAIQKPVELPQSRGFSGRGGRRNLSFLQCLQKIPQGFGINRDQIQPCCGQHRTGILEIGAIG